MRSLIAVKTGIIDLASIGVIREPGTQLVVPSRCQ